MIRFTSLYNFVKLNKLDEVLGTALNGDFITIESHHVREVFVADAHNDYADRQVAGRDLDKAVDSLLHVMYFTISEDEEDVVMLGFVFAVHNFDRLAEHIGEIGRSAHLHFRGNRAVSGEDFIDAFDLLVARRD